MSLDIPFYRTSPVSALINQDMGIRPKSQNPVFSGKTRFREEREKKGFTRGRQPFCAALLTIGEADESTNCPRVERPPISGRPRRYHYHELDRRRLMQRCRPIRRCQFPDPR